MLKFKIWIFQVYCFVNISCPLVVQHHLGVHQHLGVLFSKFRTKPICLFIQFVPTFFFTVKPLCLWCGTGVFEPNKPATSQGMDVLQKISQADNSWRLGYLERCHNHCFRYNCIRLHYYLLRLSNWKKSGRLPFWKKLRSSFILRKI